MSQGTVMIQAQSRLQEKDFTVATPEEFVRRFAGTKVIDKVNSSHYYKTGYNVKDLWARKFLTENLIRLELCHLLSSPRQPTTLWPKAPKFAL